MSVAIWPKSARNAGVAFLSGLSAFVADRMKLFQNNLVPTADTILSDLTEATFSGYSAGMFSGGALGGSLDAFNRGYATWSPLTWTKSGATGNTIYGYYVTNSGGSLLWIERFDIPIPMTTDGAYLVITPRLTFTSQF